MAGAQVCGIAVNPGFSVRSTEKAVAPPAGLGTRVSRYRCCLPALAGFST